MTHRTQGVTCKGDVPGYPAIGCLPCLGAGLLADGAFESSVSVPVVLEYAAVARRQARELGLTHADVDAVVDFVCAQAHHRKIFYLWRPFLRDLNDDMVLEAAVEAQCPYIITFNARNFAGVEQFGLQMLTPGEFLALIQEDA